MPLFQRLKQNPTKAPQAPAASITRKSTILLLRNVVKAGEVDFELKEEIMVECGKFGRVLDCKIVDLTAVGINAKEDQAVRVFVKFAGVSASESAFDAFNGRFFGGNRISACFFDLARFDKNELLVELTI